MDKKTALISGITGQDGDLLARLLLNKGYEVHGIKRRASNPNTQRIDDLITHEHLHLHYGDLTDSGNIYRLVNQLEPDEVYNLGAQSHVHVSFDQPEYTANVNALGTLRFLEAIRSCGLVEKTRFYQASTSELFGLVQEDVQSETTPFYPRSPYAVAKLFGHWITVNYREAYGMFASSGILFNHESKKRADTFVTRKITRTLAKIFWGKDKVLKLGNLDAQRDWGHAEDFVTMQWKILQLEKPDDFVIATGETRTVREFLEASANLLGIELKFEGSGVDEKGIITNLTQTNLSDYLEIKTANLKPGDVLVEIDPWYYRPSEVDRLIGDPSKSRKLLNFEAKHSFQDLVNEMVLEDFENERI